MSALGHKQTFDYSKAMSALPPKADMDHHNRYVCCVPKADQVRRSKQPLFNHLVGDGE
jgi:hypothetical protein